MDVNVKPVDLLVWVRQFAGLVSVGASLMHCFAVLEEGSGEPLRTITQQISDKVGGGATLSEAMRPHPSAFPQLGLALVSAGEIGGVLDETLTAWADWLERDQEFRLRRAQYRRLVAATEGGIPSSDERLSSVLPDYDVRLSEVLFCYAAGICVSAGVPTVMALRSVARYVFPERPEWPGALEQAVRSGEAATLAATLREMGLPPVAVDLGSFGLEHGELDRMMLKAAELLDKELEARMLEAMDAAGQCARG
jgi:type II secretory pathway component PulF